MTLESEKNKDIDSNGTDISFLLNAPTTPQTKQSEEQETVYVSEEVPKEKKAKKPQNKNIEENQIAENTRRSASNKKKKYKPIVTPPGKNDELNRITKAGAYYKYYVLLRSIKNTQNLVTMSKTELSKLFSSSLSTSKRVISELQARNLISIKESYSSEKQKSCTYEVLN